ncbi:hypothetical protein CABS03_02429 [Colletotrichum abscissum]|uniref:Nuclear pore protein-like protein n=2 Tax=Colletotrichum abscissum TaxID=1671311 RepID=A0A9P9XRM9_9PEZI|nr:hypothetical protein CABS02_01558 [Colletotrichum abscissum]
MTAMDQDPDHEPAIRSLGGLDVIDSNGDLYLFVGEDVEEKPKNYLVCSKALARTSTVFRKMLYGGFAESRPHHMDGAPRDWTVELPDDRQEALEMLLNISHGRFENVPEQLELTRLYQFLVVTEKYDATSITRPWARGWMEAVKTSMQNPLLLGVAYELGDAQMFNNMAMKIATECLVDDDGDLVFGYSGANRETYSYKLCNIEYLFPSGFVDDATTIRKTLLTTMLEPYASLYMTLKHGDRCMSSPQDPTGGKRCDSILLGSLIRSFAAQTIDLTAPDPVAAYRGSASALQSVLLKLELFTVHSGFSHPSSTSFSFGQTTHPRFGFTLSACEHVLQSGLREGVERSLMLRGDMSFVQPKHKEYLQKQAQKTGLSKQH